MRERCRVRLKIAMTATLVAAIATACAEDPAKVCTTTTMTQSAKSLLFEYLLGDPTGIDVAAARRAFDSVVSFDGVSLEHADAATGEIVCRARVRSPSTYNFVQIVYMRRPRADLAGYLYQIRLEPNDARAWLGVGGDTANAYRNRTR